MDKETLNYFSSRLAKEPFEDVIAAIEKIQDQPREPGETALPEIGALLALVKAMGVARINRINSAGKNTFVGFTCPSCKLSTSGYVTDDDYRTRYCPRCGQEMGQRHRERVA